MRRGGWVACAMMLVWPLAAPAGIYFTDSKAAGDVVESPTISASGVHALPASGFKSALGDWRKLRIEQPASSLRARYLAERDRLQEKVQAGNATIDDRINLSAYLIRLGQADQAIPLLESTARSDRQHATFMVYANLGTAYQLTNELRSAADYLGEGLRALKRTKGWPGIDKTRAGWEDRSKEWLDWYRRAEEYQLKLVRIRRREAPRPGQQQKPPEDVDDLFQVHFVGDSGEYEAGKVAAAEREKLPPDALALVQQLSLWLPDDSQLYWLAGELMNAEGRWEEAKPILDECADSRGLNAGKLRQHRQVLQEAFQKANVPLSWLPDSRKLILVGGGAGFLVVLLLYWQIRELRRRRPVNSR